MILLTGATGLLGMHVLYDLTKKGRRVRAMYRDAVRIERVEQLFNYYDAQNAQHFLANVEWFLGDIEELICLEEAFIGDIDLLFAVNDEQRLSAYLQFFDQLLVLFILKIDGPVNHFTFCHGIHDVVQVPTIIHIKYFLVFWVLPLS
jgi:hypothetical protein